MCVDVVDGIRGLVEGCGELRVLFHVDLDGVCSAAVVARRVRACGGRVLLKPVTARGVYRWVRRWLGLGCCGLVLDLGLRSVGEGVGVASAVRGRGLRLGWVDHHVWPGRVLEELRSAGVLLLVDRGAPTSGLVCRVLGCRGVEWEVARLGVFDDECRRDPGGLVGRWRLVLRFVGFDGLVRAVESLASGVLWPGWADEVYRLRVGEYRELLSRVVVREYCFDGVSVAVVSAPPRLGACDLELWGVLPRGVDIVVVLYPRSISIRAVNPVFDAACIAGRLGGGGHRGAAGAPRPGSMGPAAVARMVARLASRCRVGGG